MPSDSARTAEDDSGSGHNLPTSGFALGMNASVLGECFGKESDCGRTSIIERINFEPVLTGELETLNTGRRIARSIRIMSNKTVRNRGIERHASVPLQIWMSGMTEML